MVIEKREDNELAESHKEGLIGEREREARMRLREKEWKSGRVDETRILIFDARPVSMYITVTVPRPSPFLFLSMSRYGGFVTARGRDADLESKQNPFLHIATSFPSLQSYNNYVLLPCKIHSPALLFKPF